MSYTDLEKVSKILASSQGKRVRTSSTAIRDIKPEFIENNDPSVPINLRKTRPNFEVIINTSLLFVSPDYVGDQIVYILFSNANDYSLFKVVNNVFLLQGTGSKDSDTSVLDGLVTISDGCLSGTTTNGTLIKIELSAHISDSDIEEYIRQTEYIVDNIISENSVGFSLDGSSLVFEDEPPEPVKIATAYMTAFYIYTDVFADVQADVADAEYSFAFRWRKRAESVLEKFCRWRSRGLPVVVAFPNIVTSVGVDGIAGGAFTETDNVDEIVAGVGAEEILNTENQ